MTTLNKRRPASSATVVEPTGATAPRHVVKKARIGPSKGGNVPAKKILRKPQQKQESSSESEESLDEAQEEDVDEDDKQESRKAKISTEVGGGKKFLYGTSMVGIPASEDDDGSGQEEDELADEDFMDDDFGDVNGVTGSEEEADGEEGEEGSDQEQNQGPKEGKTAFADAMSKILSKTITGGDAPILAKDKTIERKLEEEKIEAKARKTLVREKRAKSMKERAPISTYDILHERALKKISTRGVVKLFNAIRKQQSGGREATSAAKERKKAKKDSVAQLSKSGFLDLLKSSRSSGKKPAADPTKATGKWDALKDDYMMGAKLKDWEKEKEEDIEGEYEKEMESEFE